MKSLWLKSKQTPKGLTLLEVIVATLVVGILTTSILPVFLLATAIRVQARRVDQATQIGRGFLERLAANFDEVKQLRDAYSAIVVPTDGSCSGGANPYTFDCVLPPGASGGITLADLDRIPGVKVDTNGDGFSTVDPQDFVIQPIINTNVGITATEVYRVGVRVYRANAFTGGSNLQGLAGPPLIPTASDCQGIGSIPINCPLAVMNQEVSGRK